MLLTLTETQGQAMCGARHWWQDAVCRHTQATQHGLELCLSMCMRVPGAYMILGGRCTGREMGVGGHASIEFVHGMCCVTLSDWLSCTPHSHSCSWWCWVWDIWRCPCCCFPCNLDDVCFIHIALPLLAVASPASCNDSDRCESLDCRGQALPTAAAEVGQCGTEAVWCGAQQVTTK